MGEFPAGKLHEESLQMIVCLRRASVYHSSYLFWCWYWKVRRLLSWIRKLIIMFFFVEYSFIYQVSDTKNKKYDLTIVEVGWKVGIETHLMYDYYWFFLLFYRVFFKFYFIFIKMYVLFLFIQCSHFNLNNNSFFFFFFFSFAVVVIPKSISYFFIYI